MSCSLPPPCVPRGAEADRVKLTYCVHATVKRRVFLGVGRVSLPFTFVGQLTLVTARHFLCDPGDSWGRFKTHAELSPAQTFLVCPGVTVVGPRRKRSVVREFGNAGVKAREIIF